MEEQLNQLVSSPAPTGAAEERMLRADLVRETVARGQRGEGAKRIARELGAPAALPIGTGPPVVSNA